MNPLLITCGNRRFVKHLGKILSRTIDSGRLFAAIVGIFSAPFRFVRAHFVWDHLPFIIEGRIAIDTLGADHSLRGITKGKLYRPYAKVAGYIP